MCRTVAFVLGTVFAATVVFAPAASTAADEPISRLPSVTETPSDPDTAAAFALIRSRGGQLINLHLTLGHAGKIYRVRQELTYALRFDAVTSRALTRVDHHAHRADQRLPL